MRENLDLLGFFMLGLLGGFGHCIGMCGPFVLYISRRFGTPESSRAAILSQQGLYGLGRFLHDILKRHFPCRRDCLGIVDWRAGFG